MLLLEQSGLGFFFFSFSLSPFPLACVLINNITQDRFDCGLCIFGWVPLFCDAQITKNGHVGFMD